MKDWGRTTPPAWVRTLAAQHARPLVSTDQAALVPLPGDLVLKPFIDSRTYNQLFRIETWETHDLLDGPFHDVRDAMEAALELGVTARLVVWLDYSDDPASHDLDHVPLYFADHSAAATRTVA
jgi:hypothetical protein